MDALDLTLTQAPGGVLIALRGELDLAGADALEQALATAAGAPAIVVDLRDVDFMDSSGLRAIAVASGRAQDCGQRFALVPGAAQVMRVFEITRMRERLEFVDDAREVVGGP